MAEFEIDHGEPKAVRKAPAPVPAPATELAQEARLREALPAAIACIQDAARQRHLVDMLSVVLAGLCGQGLGGALRIDPWTGGATLGLLASLAGLAGVAWAWWRSHLVADALWALPVPLDDTVIKRMGDRDERQRAVELARREDELTRIDLLDGDLAMCRQRLRLALWGAGAGSLCGWACGLTGPVGTMTMAASAAALPGAVLGWRIAGGGWPAILVQRLVIGGLTGCALVTALASGTPWLGAFIGAALVVAAGVVWRQRIDAIAQPHL